MNNENGGKDIYLYKRSKIEIETYKQKTKGRNVWKYEEKSIIKYN